MRTIESFQLVNLPETHAIGIRFTGHHAIEENFQKLIQWAHASHLMQNQPILGLMYHDSFKDTSWNKVRMTCFILCEEKQTVTPPYLDIALPAQTYIRGQFELQKSEFTEAWKMAFNWATENKYQPNGDAMEWYIGSHLEHPEGKFTVELFIPVAI